MLRKSTFASLLASSALTLAIATPAMASKSDRVREAIAAAEAKIHTAESLGAAVDSPRDTADARAALARAKEDFRSGRKDPAIDEAIRAANLADVAIGVSQRRKEAALASARDAERATAEAARDRLAAAQSEASAAQQEAAAAQQQAQQQAATAQQQIDQANARAEAAQQAAAAAAADAAAARTAAQLAASQPPPAPPQVETTLTTRQPGASGYQSRTKVTKKRRTTSTTAHTVRAPVAAEITAQTKVTPAPQ